MGFFTSIWMEGNQRASLPWNLGLLRGFSISILNCGDQGASLPRSKWKVIKGLLYLETWDDWKASRSQSKNAATKGLLYLDMNGVLPCHFVLICSCWNFEHCMTWLEILAWSCCTLGFGAFFNCWVICELVNLCFRLGMILWKKLCGWLEVCSLWHALNLLNLFSMKWTG